MAVVLYGVGDFFQSVAVFCRQGVYGFAHGDGRCVGRIGGKKDAVSEPETNATRLMTIMMLSATLMPTAMAATSLWRLARKCRMAERTAVTVLRVLLAASG